MSTESVQIGDQRLRVRRCGRGNPLLLIMGLGGSIESWEPLPQQLTGYELILVDHPGMGDSPAPLSPVPMTGLARLYDRMLAVMGYGPVDVLGYSFGGTVAQQLAIQHPARVNRMVLAATACGWGGVPMTFPAMMASASPIRYYSPEYRQAFAPFIYAGQTGRNPGRLAAVPAPRPSLKGLMYQIAAYSAWTSLPWLHRLRQPTLVLAGEEDPMAPVQNSKLLARCIPNATLHIFPRAGHLFLFDETSAVVPILNSFLQAVPAAKAV